MNLSLREEGRPGGLVYGRSFGPLSRTFRVLCGGLSASVISEWSPTRKAAASFPRWPAEILLAAASLPLPPQDPEQQGISALFEVFLLLFPPIHPSLDVVFV